MKVPLKAAILFPPPILEQPLKWHSGQPQPTAEDVGKTGITKAISAPATTPKVASLTASRASGEFQFEGGGLQMGGSAAGLSGDATPARNLRGKNLRVEPGQTSLRVRFPQPDAEYAVSVEHPRLANRAISDTTADGLTLSFAAAAPGNARPVEQSSGDSVRREPLG